MYSNNEKITTIKIVGEITLEVIEPIHFDFPPDIDFSKMEDNGKETENKS